MNLLNVIDDSIVQTITIHAPAARIFSALTCSSELLKWWASEGRFKTVEAEIDLRPGGSWHMRLEGACGPGTTATSVRGVYRIVDPPHRLSFTWNRDGEDSPETLVTWELEEHGDSTTVRVTHSGLNTDALRTRNSGWPLIQDLCRPIWSRMPENSPRYHLPGDSHPLVRPDGKAKHPIVQCNKKTPAEAGVFSGGGPS